MAVGVYAEQRYKIAEPIEKRFSDFSSDEVNAMRRYVYTRGIILFTTAARNRNLLAKTQPKNHNEQSPWQQLAVRILEES